MNLAHLATHLTANELHELVIRCIFNDAVEQLKKQGKLITKPNLRRMINERFYFATIFNAEIEKKLHTTMFDLYTGGGWQELINEDHKPYFLTDRNVEVIQEALRMENQADMALLGDPMEIISDKDRKEFKQKIRDRDEASWNINRRR